MAEGGLPNVDIQKSIITEQLKKPLVKEDIWYILDAKWLMHWKTYVGFDSWDTYNVGVESCNPGPIDNTPLFQEGSTKLKEHLVDDLDYVLIPQEGWEKLVSWYGMIKEQEPLTRKVIEEGVYTKSLKVEIYPWHLKICENSKPDEQVCREFSRADTIAQLEKAVRAEFKIADEKEVRLWSRYMSNINELLSKKEKTLQDAGLYAGQVIVVEQKNDDGTWPRQTTSKSTYNSSTGSSGSSLSTRSGNTYGSSSSYNNFSYYEPGRDRVTPGLCGLSNIGNTCFMNSALQCMSNVPKLTEYFLSNKWTEEVNENNPLGMHGEIAHSYAKLVHIMWSGNYSYTVPKNFKYAVGRFAPQFSGYQQQDSQELMAFLLDGLHEDLNRIREKPYVEIKDAENRPDTVVAKEAWDNYKKRNNSIIVDTFHGLLKSTVQCPDCDKISVTFDPFCYLSLPLPVKKERQLEVFWVPLDPNKDTVQYKLTVPKLGCVADLCDALSAYVDVKQDFMMVTDVYNHRFHKIFLKSEALSSIMERDDIFVYEMPISSLEDEDKVVLAIYMREEREKSPYQSHQLFGQPLLLAVPKYNCTYQHLYELVLHRISRIVTVPADNYKWWIKHSEKAKQEAKFTSDSVDANMSSPMHDKGDSAHCDEVKTGLDDSGMEVSNGDTKNGEVSSDSESDRYSVLNSHTNNETSLESEQVPRLFKFSIVNSYGTAELEQKLNDDTQPIKLSSRMYLSMDWKRLAKELFYKESIADAIDSHDTTKTKPQKKQVLQLSDCLELFTTTEKLGENDLWFCPVCKKQQQATKKFDLWSLPDTLIIHLKRFLYNRHWRDKIDTLVEFPAISLDLSKYVIDPSKDHCMYELIAVSNHYGGLGGGHYTAYCKNIEEEAWYNFDDASVSKAHEESTVSKAAYVLVYQRTGTWRSRKKTSQTAATTTKAEPEMNGIDSKTVEYMDTN